MNENGLYDDQYERFYQERERMKGYDFEASPSGSVAPPAVTFAEKLRWWTWDRWRRMKKIREERDRRQLDIVQLARGNPQKEKAIRSDVAGEREQ